MRMKPKIKVVICLDICKNHTNSEKIVFFLLIYKNKFLYGIANQINKSQFSEVFHKFFFAAEWIFFHQIFGYVLFPL